MQPNSLVIFVLGVSLVSLLSHRALTAEAQIFDQLLNGANSRNNAGDQSQNVGSRFGSMFRDMMSVNVPVFYDMVKNGSSMGINVLSGLVKVERGEEAERSGLQGRRPLSVRVFGIPVYERGVRVRSLNDMPNEIPNSIPSTNANEPKVVGGSDDELPIYNFRENPYKMVPL